MAAEKDSDDLDIGPIDHKTAISCENKKLALTTWDDRAACNKSENNVSDAYAHYFGTAQDEVLLNDDFCKRNDWYSYNGDGTLTCSNVKVLTKSKVAATQSLVNKSKVPYQNCATLKTSVEDSAMTTVTTSSEISVGLDGGYEEPGSGCSLLQSFSFCTLIKQCFSFIIHYIKRVSDEPMAVNEKECDGFGTGPIVHNATMSSNIEELVLTTWEDMAACGMPKDKVSDAYAKYFGTTPGKVHLNDDLCKRFDWYSYNGVGKLNYRNVRIVPKSKTAATRSLENKSDVPYDASVTLKTSVEDSATTTVTTSSEISVGQEISVGPEELGVGFSFSHSFSFKNEHGSSSSQKSVVEVSDTITVKVPPHTKLQLLLEVMWEERKEDFEIPFYIHSDGYTGAQFPHRVKDHYYWAVPHNILFSPPFQSKLRGSLTAAYNTRGKVIIGKLEKLS